MYFRKSLRHAVHLACLSASAIAAAQAPSNSVTVRASGTLAVGIGPRMELRVNGALVGSREVRAEGLEDYQFPNISVPPGALLDIVFTNDYYRPGGDRNLFVDSITVNGQTIPATAPGVTFDRGSGAEAFDGKDVLPGLKTLNWNGSLRFKLASTVTPPPVWSLTASISGSGSVLFSSAGATQSCNATCTLPFASGSTVTLTATPAAGYAFAGWSGACSGIGPCVVNNITSAKTVAAVFNALPGSGPLLRWQAPGTLANGSPVSGLTGYKVYASKTRHDLAPTLVKTVTDPAAQSTIVPGLASGTWHFWVSATSSASESELHYNSAATVP